MALQPEEKFKLPHYSGKMLLPQDHGRGKIVRPNFYESFKFNAEWHYFVIDLIRKKGHNHGSPSTSKAEINSHHDDYWRRRVYTWFEYSKKTFKNQINDNPEEMRAKLKMYRRNQRKVKVSRNLVLTVFGPEWTATRDGRAERRGML